MPQLVPDPDDERKCEEAYRKALAAYDEQVRRSVRPAGRKPLPPHIVKRILAANSEAMLAVPPWLQEMDDRAMAAIEARRAAKVRPPKRRTWDA